MRSTQLMAAHTGCDTDSTGLLKQGKTYEEAVENIKDAIRLHVEDCIADGEEFPR